MELKDHQDRTAKFQRCVRLLIAGTLIVLANNFAVFAGELPHNGTILIKTFDRIETELQRNGFGVPLYLESFDQNGRLHVDVYGIFAHPFPDIIEALKVPANWCEIASLHPNIKACTYKELPGSWLLTLYGGRKVYQHPADAYQFTFQSRKVEQLNGYIDIVLTSDKGPFGTSDHRMRFEAIPLDRSRTFTHVSYDYNYGRSLRLAEKIYFATLGRNKVGFTITDVDGKGRPVYITGPRGAIERNTVRYYFAIQSFMDTLHYAGENRFARRVNEWYDLTCRFRKQLVELDKKDYLSYKAEEHQNQVMLQQRDTTVLQ
jgi:hypothetical protein